MLYYAASTNGFYDSSFNNALPADAVKISEDEHASLLKGQSGGAVLTADGDGHPKLVVQPKASAAQMWERIKAESDRRTTSGGYVAGGKWWHSDLKSRTQQMGLLLLGNSVPANLQWRTMDGSFATLTPALAQQILAAALAKEVAIFNAAETHKAACEASPDPSSYDFSGGWPKDFGE